MGRSLLIVALVGVLTLADVAMAEPAQEVRLPLDTADEKPGDGFVVVEKGDHLWSISSRHVSDSSPETPVGPYWRRVVTVNTPNLRSGDPDLIYPGEVVELPEISEQP
jgi:nucleoid-associated protein YgaU